jgi:hypothetical protein
MARSCVAGCARGRRPQATFQRDITIRGTDANPFTTDCPPPSRSREKRWSRTGSYKADLTNVGPTSGVLD